MKKLRREAEEAITSPEMERAKLLMRRRSLQRQCSAPCLTASTDRAIMTAANTTAPFFSTKGLLTRASA